jgi:hypothetical protein
MLYHKTLCNEASGVENPPTHKSENEHRIHPVYKPAHFGDDKDWNHHVLWKIWDFTAVTMKNAVSWDVAPCRSCVNRCFGGGTYRLHLQSRKIGLHKINTAPHARRRHSSSRTVRHAQKQTIVRIYWNIRPSSTVGNRTSLVLTFFTRHYLPKYGPPAWNTLYNHQSTHSFRSRQSCIHHWLVLHHPRVALDVVVTRVASVVDQLSRHFIAYCYIPYEIKESNIIWFYSFLIRHTSQYYTY